MVVIDLAQQRVATNLSFYKKIKNTGYENDDKNNKNEVCLYIFKKYV